MKAFVEYSCSAFLKSYGTDDVATLLPMILLVLLRMKPSLFEIQTASVKQIN